MHCVVGSGPSGIACAQALLDKGLEVRMLDAGLKLEASRAQAVEQLSTSDPAGWDPKLVAMLQEQLTATAAGLPQKLSFGSDFPYRDGEKILSCTFDGVGLRPSLAQGGLSNVWGAAMLPHLDSDIGDWPVKTAQLASHYSAVLKMTGMAARRDSLAALFPLYTDEPGTLELSRQARTMLDRMDRNQAQLRQNGIHHGGARVAVKARRSSTDTGCVYCGMCMHGCPYGYIYNSASTLRELERNPRFTYQPDTIVTSLIENADSVTIHSHDRLADGEQTTVASRVYLAAGVIPTTKLLLESRRDFDRTLWMKDSQYFLIPLLFARRTPGIRQEALHTLSQLFLEIIDPAISSHAVHVQIYTYSNLIRDAVQHALSRFRMNADFLAAALEGRLVVAQGFLHSNDSSKIAVTLRQSPTTRLELKAEINPRVRSTVRKVAHKLLRNAWRLGVAPVLPMVHIAEPGRSYHGGGTFPMREQPGPFESDTLGRPQGWRRVHAVDATILPSIPGTTITLSVMANAHRIGWESASLT
jgi:choline dehydrogenase-like flavoprotein